MDALLIVQALSSSTLDNSVFGIIISDCKFLLNEINQCKVLHTKRSANRVAHFIARASVSQSDLIEWLVNAPLFIADVLENDIHQ